MESTITKFGHLQIPIEDVLKATDNFDDKNVIGRGELGIVYKGRLLHSGKRVKIAARRLNNKHKHNIEFLREISALSSLKHENIVSIIGFCDEKGEKVIINKHEAKGSLVRYLSNPNLTWNQRLRISVGIARALSYMHKEDGRSYSVIHRNINSSTILLNNKFGAKLSGFEYSINHPVNRMDDVFLSEAIGTRGYVDPEIGKTGGVTHKSDIYSFGVVLLELLCGRKAFLPNEDDKFLVSLVKLKYEENSMVGNLILPCLSAQICHRAQSIFLPAAVFCVKDERVQRPHMKYIVGELEKAFEFQRPYESLNLQRSSLNQLTSQFSHFKFRLDDITLATNNFSPAYRIMRNDWYDIYVAGFEHCDEENCVCVEEKNESERPKRRYIYLKRMRPREDKLEEEELFRTDIEMLTTCNHPNIVTPLGICNEDPEKILIVEGSSNGFLAEYLKNKRDKYVLTWEKRLKICLDVANGLKYLHHEMEDQKTVINRYFSTNSIALDESFRAEIVDLVLSVFVPPNQDVHGFGLVVGSPLYSDPEYLRHGKLKRESDVYSLGVAFFEILCGRVANDQMYTTESEVGLAYTARSCFLNGTLMEIIDPIIKEESDDNKDSIDTFVKIAYRCLAETQDQRPTMKDIIKELEKALSFQPEQCHKSDQIVDVDGYDKLLDPKSTHEIPEHSNYAVQIPEWKNLKENISKNLKIRLSDILSATNSFSEACIVWHEGHYRVYKAELEHFNQEIIGSVEEKYKSEPPKRRTTALIKRLFVRINQQKQRRESLFLHEIEKLSICKHPNIVTLVGFCDEDSEMILVFENTIKLFLAEHFLDFQKQPHLTWSERLRICLDVAYGMKYLHYEMEEQKVIIHRNIRSRTIALDENLRARIFDFGRSIFLPPYLDDDTLHLNEIIGSHGYIDPEYEKTGKLKRESDIYSFGVLLCEVFCGKLPDSANLKESDERFAYEVRRCIREGAVMNMLDPLIKEEISSDGFSLNKGPNKDSLDAFLKIVDACLVETQDKRPTIKVVVEELKKALMFQENNKDTLRISYEDIKLATENFDDKNCVGEGGFGKVYKGKLPQSDNTIVAKQLDTRGGQGDKQFQNELQILFKYKHGNIISIVGYCDEKDAKIIVYEYAPRGSLDKYLGEARLNWMKRLNICIGVATALDFLHRGIGKQATVIHRDIKTANILLTNDWNAKLADFGLSLISAINKETDYAIDRACGTPGYVDPLYLKSGFLTKESDIYSFGVVLFEILCGRSTFETHKREGIYLPSFINRCFENEKRDDVVFEKIKAQIMPKALTTFRKIAYRCLREDREKRPKAKEVVKQLKKALRFQMLRDDLASTTSS
ncbi:uncharacterized protein [Rutidosis leptorrhynchoides]|uniref:uncharacterized protein isoform X2 n=1 Tax=Rutidosis leptorrhynchoides TaxID=125765 RepID=UPI003A9A5324